MRGFLGALLVVASLLSFGQGAAAAEAGFHSAWVGQSAWPVMLPGATLSYTLQFRNTGTETWQRGVLGKQVNLGVVNDSIAFRAMNVGWISDNRPATTVEASVAPGAIGTFTFTIKAPATPGAYDLPLRPVADGVTWMEHQGVFVRVTSDLGFHSKWVGQSANPTLAPGATSADITITFRNTGTRTWTKGVPGQQANLGIRNDDRTWSSLAVSWLTPDRPATQTEATVAPGANATFTFKVKAPQAPSTYVLALRPVIDGVTWLEDEGVFVAVTVSGGAKPLLSTSVVQAGLRNAWDVAFAPDGRMFVTERVGNLLVYANALQGAVQLANNAIAGVRQNGEGGLMSVELDPAFAQNHYLYVCASRDDPPGLWRNQVLRYIVVGNALAFDRYVIRDGMQAGSNHDGCRLRFGPDGKLWVTMGDAGNGNNAQNPNSLNGKVLRVNSDGTIPNDNPVLPGAAARSAVFTWGNRNPQGLTFEPVTGRVFEVEHGDATQDEVNILAAGANYGYPLYRGPVNRPGYVDPAWSSGNVTLATSGGDFLRGPQWGLWNGSLVVATLKEQDVRRFELFDASARQADILFNDVWGRLRTPRLAPDGSLYLTTDNGADDKIIRVVATQP
ncbi:MAG TPA: PQQ-dependent sugar dehydrogenase [Candidatus Limnocylindrales bacterium]|nr:PQQ-dependent sugar dehydrogenase [Candidatus Limnocylindrales bacterium]